jgi:hypothetical protein
MFTAFLDFEIQLRLLEANHYALDVSSSLGGDAHGTLRLPTDDPAFQALVGRLERLDVDEDMLVELGQMLFRTLFQGQIKDVYIRSQGALGPGQGLRLRFNIDTADTLAAGLPWEFLADPDQGPLAMLDMPVVRYLPQQTKLPMLATALPLKVLLSAAQPTPALETARELDEIQVALDELALGNRVRITVEPHLTIGKLQKFLREGFHVWHFIGQGELSKDRRTGLLNFEDPNGGADPVSALQLGVLLNRGELRLALLNCGSSSALMVAPFRGVASALIRAQVPAVITMQMTAPQEATRAFAGEFYRALAAGFPIDACVTEGRRAIMGVTGLSVPDWGIPVVYTRAPDGKLFDLIAPAAPREVQQPLADTSRSTSPAAEDSRSVGKGLIALTELMQVPEVRAAVAIFRTAFQAASEQIRILNYYKTLHDLFQELEDRYQNLIEPDLKRLATDQTAWSSLHLHEPVVGDIVEELLAAGGQSAIAVDISWWAQQLSQAQAELQAAIQRLDGDGLEAAIHRLYRVIDREPSRINTRLVAAADALRLSDLIEAMTTLHDKLTHSRLDLVATQQIAESIDALVRLNASLHAQVKYHQSWQDIEDELRRVETNLDRDYDELVRAWPDVRVMAQTLFGSSSDPWAISLNKLSGEIEAALATQIPEQVTWHFLQYRRKATRRFRKVDRELLDLCNDLQMVGTSMEQLLRTIQ